MNKGNFPRVDCSSGKALNFLTAVILGYRMSLRNKCAVVRMAKKAGIVVREARPEYTKYGVKIVPYDGNAD